MMDFREALAAEKERYLTEAQERSRAAGGVVIYGAGSYGKGFLRLLRENHISVDGFVVTDASHNREKVCGLPVWSIDELAARRQDCLVLVGVKDGFCQSIEAALRAHHIADYRMPPAHTAELIDDAFFRPCLEITPKAGCSVHCRFCPQDLLLGRYYEADRAGEMTFEDFKLCLDKTPKDLIVDFSGFVEPFLAKDGLRMVAYAHESGHEVRLFTTLVGLDREMFRRIEDIPFKLVVLHLPDVHQYAHIPMTEEYMALLQEVIEKKRPDGEPFVDMANCQSEPHPAVMKLVQGKVLVSSDLVDRAGNLDDASLRSAEEKEGPIYCSRSVNLEHNVLLPSGDVVLCCMDFGMQRVIGNLKEQSYEEIVQGEPLERVRRANAAVGDLLCRKCTYAKKRGKL